MQLYNWTNNFTAIIIIILIGVMCWKEKEVIKMVRRSLNPATLVTVSFSFERLPLTNRQPINQHESSTEESSRNVAFFCFEIMEVMLLSSTTPISKIYSIAIKENWPEDSAKWLREEFRLSAHPSTMKTEENQDNALSLEQMKILAVLNEKAKEMRL